MTIELNRITPVGGDPRVGYGLTQTLKNWVTRQLFKRQVQRERRDLATLPPRLLRDIGVEPIDAKRESRRTSSDMPASREP